MQTEEGFLAQTYIQRLILRALAGRESVFFVQVGSNDGQQGDPLHELLKDHTDWRGLFIEPIDFLMERLRQHYASSDRFLYEQVAIGNETREETFYYVAEEARQELTDLPAWYDQLGSFNRDHIVKYLPKAEPFIVERKVPCLPLQDVLDRNGIETIDLVHIDTEGFDYQVLLQIDLERYRPAVILYEHIHVPVVDRQAARNLLREAGYRVLPQVMDTVAIAGAVGR